MNKKPRRVDALLIEDFDIRRDVKSDPEKMVGVRTSQIYAQIAKMGLSSRRKSEVEILIATIDAASSSLDVEPTYIPMTIANVEKCFRNSLKLLAPTTFVEL